MQINFNNNGKKIKFKITVNQPSFKIKATSLLILLRISEVLSTISRIFF